MEYKLKWMDQKAIYNFWKHIVKSQIQNFMFKNSDMIIYCKKGNYSHLKINDNQDGIFCYVKGCGSELLWARTNFGKYYIIKFNRLCKILRRYQKKQSINEFDVSKHVTKDFIPETRYIEIEKLRNEVKIMDIKYNQLINDYTAIMNKIGI